MPARSAPPLTKHSQLGVLQFFGIVIDFNTSRICSSNMRLEFDERTVVSCICSQQASVKSCLRWPQLCSCCHQFNSRCWFVAKSRTPCNRSTLLISVSHRSKSSPREVLQSIRSPTHLLMQQPFPRTHVQLEESFTCQIRVAFVELRVSFAITQETNLSTPYDQLHTAHPHVHVHNAHIHCVDGCNANAYNLQTQHNKQFHVIQNNSYRTSQKLGANPSDGQRNNHVKQKIATCMTHEIRAQMQKNHSGQAQQNLEPCALACGQQHIGQIFNRQSVNSPRCVDCQSRGLSQKPSCKNTSHVGDSTSTLVNM